MSGTTGDYFGLSTRVIANECLRLEFLAEAGPRIVRLTVNGSENLLAELPDVHWPTPYGDYYVRGGHRLCHAPEAVPRSYIPDNDSLDVEDLENGVRLCRPPEVATGISKSLEISLDARRPQVRLCHRLQNDGVWPVELAAWAITQLPLGGIAVLPQRAASLDTAGVLPDRHLVLWPYSRWADPRLHLEDEVVWIEALPQAPALKVGYQNSQGWIAYARRGVLFLKRFQPHVEQRHADRGCNVEVYCNEYSIELETLGPLCRLAPGECVTHVETWEIYPGLDTPPALSQVQAMVLSANRYAPTGQTYRE